MFVSLLFLGIVTAEAFPETTQRDRDLALKNYKYEIICGLDLKKQSSQIATYETCTLEAFQYATMSVTDEFFFAASSEAKVIIDDDNAGDNHLYMTKAIVTAQREVLLEDSSTNTNTNSDPIPDVWTRRRILRGAAAAAPVPRKLFRADSSSAFGDTFDEAFKSCLSKDGSFKKGDLRRMACSGFRISSMEEPLPPEVKPYVAGENPSTGTAPAEEEGLPELIFHESNNDNNNDFTITSELLNDVPNTDISTTEKVFVSTPPITEEEEEISAKNINNEILEEEELLLDQITTSTTTTTTTGSETAANTVQFRYEVMCEISISAEQVAAYESCTQRVFQAVTDPQNEVVTVSDPMVMNVDSDSSSATAIATIAQVTLTFTENSPTTAEAAAAAAAAANNDHIIEGGRTYSSRTSTTVMWNTNMSTDELVPDVFRRSLVRRGDSSTDSSSSSSIITGTDSSNTPTNRRKLVDRTTAAFKDSFDSEFKTCLSNNKNWFSKKQLKNLQCAGYRLG